MYEDYYNLAQDGAALDTEALSEQLELESLRYSRRLSEEDEARQR